MLIYTTTDAEIFKVFLDYMLKYLKQEEIELKDIGIILDNWSIHRANTVREYCRRMNIRMYYLPQYSPELAQWRTILTNIKRDIVKEFGDDLTDLREKESVSRIARCIHNISHSNIRRLWSRLIGIVDEVLKQV